MATATKKAKEEGVIKNLAVEFDLSQTYNPLLTALHENDKRNLFSTNVNTAFIKTGFPVFDYYFGSVINVHDDLGNIIRQDPRVGQAAGTFNLIIGNTGSGKTTLAEQIAGNMLRQFKYANVMHFDCENRTDISRIETVTQLPSYYFKSINGAPEIYMLKSGAVGLNVIQKMIVETYATKMKLKDQLMVETGYTDEFGKPIKIFHPTICIIDSITSVIEESFNVENNKEVSKASEMRSNTEGARDAKTLKGFFKDILPLCKEANIIIYGINHINTNMSMNAFIPVARQQNFMKQDEIIPGGKTMLYYPYNIIKLTARPSDDFTEEGDGFEGHIVMVEPVKCSSNQSGNDSKGISFEMVFSFKNGFDPLRTMIHYGKEYGMIDGNRSRMKFKEDPDCTFSWKDIYTAKDEKPIIEDLQKYVYPHLNTHLSYIEPSKHVFDDRLLTY